jgi:putative ABC transport system permease protein
MLRDIKRSAGAYFLISAVVAVGILANVSLRMAKTNLDISKDSFYRRTNFAEGFVSVVSAPLSAARRLESIPGVRAAQGRLARSAQVTSYPVGEVELRLTGSDFSGISVPELIEGRYPERGEYAMTVNLEFFRAHELSLGDALRLSLNGRECELAVTGVVQSPETVYLIKNLQDLYPDNLAYGAAFMEPGLLGALLGESGVANEFVFTLEPGADFDEIKSQAEDALVPFGVQAVYPRKDQMSHSLLQGEIDQLGKMADFVPILMLSVAAIIIYITLRRLIEQQRGQIGVLKSFGYADWEVTAHYLLYASAIGLFGGMLGGAAGAYLAAPMTEMYGDYFSLPGLVTLADPSPIVGGIAMSVAFCTMAALPSVLGVLKLRPAEAMRPQAPSFSGKTLVEKVPILLAPFAIQGRMALRNLLRNRRRSLLTLIGMSAAFAIMATLLSMYTLIDVFVFDDLLKVQRQDVKVVFDGPVSAADALRYAQLPGVQAAEPIAELAAKIRGPEKEQDLLLLGIPAGAALYRLYDMDGNPVSLPEEGITLSSHLANLLKVGVGDTVEVETSYPAKRTEQVPVTAVVPQYMGSNAYMSMEALSRVTVFRNAATSLFVKADEQGIDALKERFAESSRVVSVESRMETVGKMRAMIGTFNSMMYSMALIGVLVGFAVIYTSSIITFEETKREAAAMRMLGMRPREVLEIITVEQWILAFAGILLGIPLASGASAWMAEAMATELFSMPNFIDRSSIFLAIYCTAAAVWLGSRAIYRKVRRLQPVRVLAERD